MIALDGPAASGKSTVGMALAERLGFFYLDTGVLYRALTWLALERGVAPSDGEALAVSARSARFEVRPPSISDGRQVDVLVDGRDVSWDIRRPDVDRAVSQVSAHPAVRDALLGHQRAAIRPPGTILAGRDIGTVVAPDAGLKLWITASVEERARRRLAQTGVDFATVLADMQRRDRLDSTRAAAPAVAAVDAVWIDTSQRSVEQVVAEAEALVRERIVRRSARQS